MKYCEQCGSELNPQSQFCPDCGTPVPQATPEKTAQNAQPASSYPAQNANQLQPQGNQQVQVESHRDRIARAGIEVGFSKRIESDEFKAAMGKANKTNVITLVVVAILLAPVLVFIASFLKPSNMGILIAAGVIVEIIVIAIVVYMLLKRFAGKTWDGVVTNKYVGRERSGKNGHRPVYTIEFQTDAGDKRKYKDRIPGSNMYNYLNVGDRVRYHPQLNYPFEKYDKTNDVQLLCPFCYQFQPLENDYCDKCHKPLLK